MIDSFYPLNVFGRVMYSEPFGNWSNNVTLFLDCETMIATK